VGGGGRYDNLAESLGGRATPGVGFGSGIERLLMALEAQGVELAREDNALVWLVSHGDAAREAQWGLLRELRQAGVVADMDYSGRSIKSQFKLADRVKARFCVVVGDAELSSGTAVVKDLSTGEQTPLPRAEAVERLKGIAGK
jgi:histidyl-tRNA synthetase